MLGGIYGNSEFVPNDTAEAVVWYSSAFQATSLTRSQAEKYAKELRWFLSVAEIGDGHVLLNVANLYNCTGGGLPQDSTEALCWYRLAAEKDNEGALCFIGKIYETGDGVDQDSSEALRWFQLAAERGTLAQCSTSAVCTHAAKVPRLTTRDLLLVLPMLNVPFAAATANHVKKALEVLNAKPYLFSVLMLPQERYLIRF
jgi:uncharacterized protein